MKNKRYILNIVFIIGIMVLFINDHFLKLWYSNWLTGKLSDFVGMIIFPLFLSFIFPKLKEKSVVLTLFIFIFWKSPFSQSFIDIYNEYSPIAVARVVDYTDYLAFIFLLIPYFLMKKEVLIKSLEVKNINLLWVLIPSIFVMMATSPPSYYKYNKGGYVFMNNYSFEVKKSKQEILDEIQKRNIEIEKDTSTIIIKYNEYRNFTKIPENRKLDSLSVDIEKIKNDIKQRIKNSNYYVIPLLNISETEKIEEIRFYLDEHSDKKQTTIIIESVKIDKKIIDEEGNKKLKKKYIKYLKELKKNNIL